MTQREYKKGDRVLVEAELYRMDEDGDYDAETVSGSSLNFRESDIYSHVPEFKVGEEVEVTTMSQAWHEGLFVGFTNRGQVVAESKVSGAVDLFDSCRKPQPKTAEPEPSSDDIIVLKGKKYKLTEVKE